LCVLWFQIAPLCTTTSKTNTILASFCFCSKHKKTSNNTTKQHRNRGQNGGQFWYIQLPHTPPVKIFSLAL
jgi:hypothetical protein